MIVIFFHDRFQVRCDLLAAALNHQVYPYSLYSIQPWNTAGVRKQDVFDDLTDVVRAIGSGRRFELVEMLAQDQHSVESLATNCNMATTTTSNNLQILKHNGLVATRRAGTTIFYQLAGEDVLELFLAAKRVALRCNATLRHSLETFLGSPSAQGPTIDASLVTDHMLVVDVRPRDEYEAGHFPGAISIPMDQLPERYDELPRDRQVVVYCRGELCRLAREAAVTLRGYALDAIAMDDGIAEWRVGQEITLDYAS